ncbi:MAG: class I SAM-dependent methyltransferase, partial [Thermoproteota archaeon]|nr:class I SAM-dependent methyltransferase [Thermoproteota archaeon]
MKHSSTEFATLWKYSVGFYGVWIAHIGRQMKLFDQLAARPLSIEELIINTKLYPPAVRAWCSAAQAYRFIIARNGKLQLKKQMRRMLVDRASPEYLGGQFSYLALRSLEYGAFEELFKSGKTTKMMSTLRAVEQATDWDHYAFLAAARGHERLRLPLSKGCRLLDVGCGTGSMLAKIHREYPKSSLVGVDPSGKAVAIARQIAGGKPITLIKVRGESMKFADEFDIVFLGESLYTIKNKERVVSNCWRALKKDGTIVIVEGLLPESKFDNAERNLIMGMQLDFALQGQKFMNKKDIVVLL